jgi:phosphatidylglycerol:prolipoprotein diacylglycerol transferase
VRKKFTVPGKLFSLYLLLNGIERMMIEQIRVNNKFDLLGLSVTQAEVIAAVLMLLGLSGLVFIKKDSVLNKTK